MGDLTTNFSRAEFKCKHCGEMHTPLEFIQKLQRLRDRLGFSMPINSGYRCPKYNSAVSSTGPNGPHTKAAADVGVYGERAFLLIDAAMDSGEFTGIGVSQKDAQGTRFIHLDDLPNAPGQPRPWIWSY